MLNKMFQNRYNRLDMHSNFRVNIFSNICPITTEILETFSGPIVVYDPHPHYPKIPLRVNFSG